jgi:RND superfamily putative drug exporter
MARLLHRLGLLAVRHRVIVTLAWLALLVAGGVGAATLSGHTVSTFKIPGQESTTALDLMTARFGSTATGGTAQVVVQVPDGGKVTDPGTAAKLAELVGTLGRLPGVAAATDPLDPKAPAVSPDQRAAYSTVTYRVPAPEITDAQRRALVDALARARADGFTVEARGEALHTPGAPAGPAEGIGVVVALVVLAVTFGSLLIAGMNLLTAGVGVAIGTLGITTLTGFVQLQSTTPVLAVMLGLAVGIDYALFIVTRFRDELRDGRSVEDAAALAVGTAGSAVVTAGLTVIIALAGLVVAGIPFLTQMGLAAAATIVLAVLIAITLVPAMLGFIGTRALRRRARHTTSRATDRGFYRGWAHTVSRRRWVSLLVAVVALGVVSIPFFSMRTSLSIRPETGSTQARADRIISDRFGPGVTGPSQKLNQALPVYLALVVGLAFVLLVLVFRAILVPVVGVLGFLLTIGAALGATTAVFQWGWLAKAVNAGSTGPLMSLAPIIIVGILFGLAMDYQVFLVSRMHEAHAHGAQPREAIVTGFRQAAPVVVAAATIMFGVFAGFVPEGDATIKPIGFALATGILFDAIVIRMIAVPAALALLGGTAWRLPRWLRWLPTLDVEGAALERPTSAPSAELVSSPS